ncbi:hypothetical protein Y032_0052g2206 [Ancylostoma ceylanicum]|uniref:Uncharacterized protein n=1 Tax=Ancylostoma ceylanicum TaxID=53326 RepID=A0A016U920_9BILA|nr:hypothetical protein Y032_0052g2206 [Ancylostoma ceylanicum]
MWAPSLVFVLLVASAYGSILQYPGKVGDRIELDIGRDVKTWKRVRKGDVEEFIKHCAPGENEPRCKGFVTKDNKPADPATEAHVKENGVLVIEKLKATDAGLYSSPDHQSIVRLRLLTMEKASSQRSSEPTSNLMLSRRL